MPNPFRASPVSGFSRWPAENSRLWTPSPFPSTHPFGHERAQLSWSSVSPIALRRSRALSQATATDSPAYTVLPGRREGAVRCACHVRTQIGQNPRRWPSDCDRRTGSTPLSVERGGVCGRQRETSGCNYPRSSSLHRTRHHVIHSPPRNAAISALGCSAWNLGQGPRRPGCTSQGRGLSSGVF